MLRLADSLPFSTGTTFLARSATLIVKLIVLATHDEFLTGSLGANMVSLSTVTIGG